MKVLKEPIKITLVIKRFLYLIIAIVLTSCFSDKKHDGIINGQWINITFSDDRSPLIYDFREGDKVYTKYLNGSVSKRATEVLDKELLISSDTNSNYLEKYLITTHKDDSLTLVDSKGQQIQLIPLNNIVAKSFSINELKEVLLKESWKMSFEANSRQSDRKLEFFRNQKYLFTYGSGDSLNNRALKWNVYNVDSMTVLVFTDLSPSLFFIDSLSSDGIRGNLFSTDGKSKSAFLERIESKNDPNLMKGLAGYWELNSDTNSNSIPVVMEFELEDDYRGYYMNNKSGDVLSMGSWGLSKVGNAIILDELKDGNRSVLNIIHLKDKGLTVIYNGDKLEYSKTILPL